MARILIVEDETDMARGLQYNLEARGYEVILASDGEAGYQAALSSAPDLVLLDVMLPKRDGYDVCRALRKVAPRLPVLMLTARGGENDLVLGLKLGADDYIRKPFSTAELMARIEALLRRSAFTGGNPRRVEFGDVVIDFERHQATRRLEPLELTPKEFEMVRYFAARPGRGGFARCAAECGVGLHQRSQHEDRRRAHRETAAEARRHPVGAEAPADGARHRIQVRAVAGRMALQHFTSSLRPFILDSLRCGRSLSRGAHDMRTVLMAAIAAGLLAGAPLAQGQSAADLYQSAVQLEEVKGDLEKAIAAYRSIVERFANDRTTAGKAQLRLGICYERLGRPEARGAFEAVIRNYSDQPDLVTQARARLASSSDRSGDRGDAAMIARQVWTGSEVRPRRQAVSGRSLSHLRRLDVHQDRQCRHPRSHHRPEPAADQRAGHGGGVRRVSGSFSGRQDGGVRDGTARCG